MRYLTGSSACVNSASVKRGAMCCGQFQSKASTGVLIYTYGYSAAAAGAAFLPFSANMAAGSRTAGGLAQRIGSRAMLAAGSLVTASGYAEFALSAGAMIDHQTLAKYPRHRREVTQSATRWRGLDGGTRL